MSSTLCVHLRGIESVPAVERRECEECVRVGDRWVHLRLCLACGTILCCDDSPNRHASAHAASSGHPVIASAEPGERWLYCFVDDALTWY